jgi:hypothetical protein
VHWLLFLAMLLCTITVFLDMALRRSALVGLAKALALILQGAWLVQIAVVQFEGRPQWSPEYGGGAMFAPVAFAAILLAVLASLFAFYTLLALLRQHTRLARAPFLPEEEDDEEGEEKQGSGQASCCSCCRNGWLALLSLPEMQPLPPAETDAPPRQRR